MNELLNNDYYGSPRWSQEIADCSMPMTFDQYSICSYRCLYCFSFFQKAVGVASGNYLHENVRPVCVDTVKGIFTEPDLSQFGPYVKQRLAMQWGGLADPFDEHERKYGVGLELLRFFREIQYPISFSTKSNWFIHDGRYSELIQGAGHFNFKVSIITLDEYLAGRMEVLCPSPQKRLDTIGELAKLGVGGVTLRLRPFIIGFSDLTYLELIRQAAAKGAEAVSTEFLCIETRARRAKGRYKEIAKLSGVRDLLTFYRRESPGQAGYLRMSRETKRPFIEAMQTECQKLGLRFYVSDAHFKELCANGSCCGLRPDWNYSRGQFTEALLIAKAKGQVCWSDIEAGLGYAETFDWGAAQGFNQTSSEARAKFNGFTMKGYLHYIWNHVNGGKSPYKYFGGILKPVGKDENGDVIYAYNG